MVICTKNMTKRIRGIGEKMFDVEANMNDLMILLADKYKKYTMNDHSSISVEKAQQLMDSILYCINGYLNSIDKNSNMLTTKEYNNAITLYERGLEFEKRNLSCAKKLLNKIKLNSLKIDNLSYNDTIFSGLDLFFNKYDILYAAHETPGSIDYQLAIEINEVSGIEYILKYMNQLYIENSFCNNFISSEITALLRGYNTDYKDLLLNIFEIVLQNAIGLELLNENILLLSIDDNQRQRLSNILEPLNVVELQERILIAVNNILEMLDINDNKEKTYIRKASIKLSYNIKHALCINRLENIFVTSNHSTVDGRVSFIDGAMMDAKMLRALIDELRECKQISEKIEIIKKSVHSIRDLLDILDTCIWESEYQEVFKLLSDMEREYINDGIIIEVATGIDNTDLKDWQKAFLKYECNKLIP